MIAVAADDLHQTLFAELAEVVLRFGYAIGVGDEDVAGLHVKAVFVVTHAVHEADGGAAAVKREDVAVPAGDERGKLAGVRVCQFGGVSVVVSEKERCVLLRLSAAIEMAV